MFHMKSGVVVCPRPLRLLEFDPVPDVPCSSFDRSNLSAENTLSWQQANNNWKKSPVKLTKS